MNRTPQGMWGPFEILEQLGQGAYGVVYRARRGGVDCALKVLHTREEAQRTRFLRESRALAKVAHPNVIRVLEAGELEGTPYLALELVRGGSLQDVLDRSGALAVERVLEIGAGLARGLEAAHALGLVHRDIKPANLLLAEEGRVVLSDFGLVFDQDRVGETARLTQSEALVGTPGFWSPEQAGGERGVGPASDLYSLGATLFTLLSGRLVFQASGIIEAAVMTRELAPPRLADLGVAIPPALERVLGACLEKDPGLRPPSAAAVAEALEAAQGGSEGPSVASGRYRWIRGAVVAVAGFALAIGLLQRGPEALPSPSVSATGTPALSSSPALPASPSPSGTPAPTPLDRSFAPPWAQVAPARILEQSYDPALGPEKNGRALQARIKALQPGDLLRISPGRWAIRSYNDVSISGRADAPIWIVGGPGVELLGTLERNLFDLGASGRVAYLCLRALELSRASMGVRVHAGREVWVDACQFREVGAAVVANTKPSQRLYVTRNSISGGRTGIQLGGAPNAASTGGFVARNLIWDTSQAAIQIRSHAPEGSRGTRGEADLDHVSRSHDSAGDHDTHDPGPAHDLACFVARGQGAEETGAEGVELSAGVAEPGQGHEGLLSETEHRAGREGAEVEAAGRHVLAQGAGRDSGEALSGQGVQELLAQEVDLTEVGLRGVGPDSGAVLDASSSVDVARDAQACHELDLFERLLAKAPGRAPVNRGDPSLGSSVLGGHLPRPRRS